MFNDSITNSFTLSFASGSTDRRTVDTQLEYQVELGSAQNINSPKYLIAAHQTAVRVGVANKNNNIAILDNPIVRQCHVDIDGIGYPRDGVAIDNNIDCSIDQRSRIETTTLINTEISN